MSRYWSGELQRPHWPLQYTAVPHLNRGSVENSFFLLLELGTLRARLQGLLGFDAVMAAWQTVYTISPSLDSTLALEVFKTGLMRGKKHLLFFENFRGELSYVRECPESSRLDIMIDAMSVVCRDKWLRPKQQQMVTSFARNQALAADRHPEIRFASTRISAKPLRGYVIEGVLKLRGTTRNVRVNVVLTAMNRGRFQIDGDAMLRLSDFEVSPPPSLLGLAGTKDEALLRLLLWATEPTGAHS